MIYIDLKQKQKASEYLQKSMYENLFLNLKKIVFCFDLIRDGYKDYQLESRLHFRINAAMQKVKRMDIDLNKRDSSK